MKKVDKREAVNLFFSAFLIIAFIVCAHYFTQFAFTLGAVAGSVVSVLLYVVFGLLLFYATRVGDGKAVKRFSLVTLIILVLPSLYIIIASLAPGLPLHDVFTAKTGGNAFYGISAIATLASVALGYGIPYTFLSGFEAETDGTEAESILEGGVEADLIETEADAEDNAEEKNGGASEKVEETASEESAEEAVSEETAEASEE